MILGKLVQFAEYSTSLLIISSGLHVKVIKLTPIVTPGDVIVHPIGRKFSEYVICISMRTPTQPVGRIGSPLSSSASDSKLSGAEGVTKPDGSP